MPSPQKGFIHTVLILALFGLIFILALFFLQVRTPNSIQMANPIPSVQSVQAADIQPEKTYNSDSLGISFTYLDQKYNPKEDTEDAYFQRANGNARKNFRYYVGYEPGEFVGAVDLVNMANGSLDDAPMTVWVFKNPENLDAAAWFNKYWYYPFNWGQFESSQKVKLAPVNATTVGGEPANYGEIDYQAGSPKYYFILKAGKIYLIRELNNDQTISSLKFIN